VDHFTRYVKAYPIPDITAETFARIYATQIVTHHGCGSKLITDQDRNFVIIFPRNLQNIRDTQDTHLEFPPGIEQTFGEMASFIT
jgi:hypothetical protein